VLFVLFALMGYDTSAAQKAKNHSKIQSRQVKSSFAGAEMRLGNEKYAVDT
jgi:hypothetical protein